MSRPDVELKRSIGQARSIVSDLCTLAGAFLVCRKYDCEKPIVEAARRAYGELGGAVDRVGETLREF